MVLRYEEGRGSKKTWIQRYVICMWMIPINVVVTNLFSVSFKKKDLSRHLNEVWQKIRWTFDKNNISKLNKNVFCVILFLRSFHVFLIFRFPLNGFEWKFAWGDCDLNWWRMFFDDAQRHSGKLAWFNAGSWFFFHPKLESRKKPSKRKLPYFFAPTRFRSIFTRVYYSFSWSAWSPQNNFMFILSLHSIFLPMEIQIEKSMRKKIW
jgi:hypothetical protein